MDAAIETVVSFCICNYVDHGIMWLDQQWARHGQARVMNLSAQAVDSASLVLSEKDLSVIASTLTLTMPMAKDPNLAHFDSCCGMPGGSVSVAVNLAVMCGFSCTLSHA